MMSISNFDGFFAGQNTAKHQFQINLVSSTDPIDVLLVNKDSEADKPSVTPVPPPKTKSSSASRKVPGGGRQKSISDNSVTTATTSAAAAENGGHENSSQLSDAVPRPESTPQTSASGKYTVSQKSVQTYFLSELCQILTDCKNFWHKDSKENKLFGDVLICPLIQFMSTHYHVKRRCSKLLHKTVIISLQ